MMCAGGAEARPAERGAAGADRFIYICLFMFIYCC